MHADDEPPSLRGEAERLRDELKPQRGPTAITKALKAARRAGWGADSDELVKLITFVVVLVEQSLPKRWRLHRPLLAIDAVRLRAHGEDSHTHVGDVRSPDGVVRPAAEVIFGLRHRHEVYVTAAENGDRVKVIVLRCGTCSQNTLSTEQGESLLLALPRF